MNEKYEVSADFVDRVMRSVRALEEEKTEACGWARRVCYLLAGSGAVIGVFSAAPAF